MQKIKLYLSFLFLAVLGSGIGLLVILTRLYPVGLGNLTLFYGDVLVFTFSLFTLLGFYIRRMFGAREMINQYLSISARQGLWLSFLVVISLFLQSQGWFSWLNAAFLVLTLIFLEAYLIVKKHDREY